MNIAICSSENVWVEDANILKKDNIFVQFIILTDFNNEEHLLTDEVTYLNRFLLNRGIVPSSYQIEGLSKEQLEIIYSYQFYFDLFFDRIEVNPNRPKLNSFEKNHIITNLIDYYISLLEKNKLDFLMFSNIPHFIYDFALYVACIITSTKTLIISREHLGTLRINESLFSRSKELDNALMKRTKYKIKYDEIESYINNLKNNDYNQIIPIYMVNQKKEKNLGSLNYFVKRTITKPLSFIQSFFVKKIPCETKMTYKQSILADDSKCTTFAHNVKNLVSSYFKKKLVREYKKYSTKFLKEDLEEISFVYLALHYQPEASSSPTGEVFANQMNIVRLISASLPENWKLIVKEHPTQYIGPYSGTGRWISFYQIAKQFNKVLFADLDTNQIDLINNAKCIATISGTVGIEALARQKQVLTFGNVWFNGLKAVKNITTKDDIEIFLNSLDWPYLNDDEMIEEMYNILSLNFKTDWPNQRRKKDYLEIPRFYSQYIQNKL